MKTITDRYRYVCIIDAGIKTNGEAYTDGLEKGVFVREAGSGQPFKGRVWPGESVFVDYLHPNATKYWS